MLEAAGPDALPVLPPVLCQAANAVVPRLGVTERAWTAATCTCRKQKWKRYRERLIMRRGPFRERDDITAPCVMAQ